MPEIHRSSSRKLIDFDITINHCAFCLNGAKARYPLPHKSQQYEIRFKACCTVLQLLYPKSRYRSKLTVQNLPGIIVFTKNICCWFTSAYNYKSLSENIIPCNTTWRNPFYYCDSFDFFIVYMSRYNDFLFYMTCTSVHSFCCRIKIDWIVKIVWNSYCVIDRKAFEQVFMFKPIEQNRKKSAVYLVSLLSSGEKKFTEWRRNHGAKSD